MRMAAGLVLLLASAALPAADYPFEGIGHLPHVEAPDEYLEALGDVILDGQAVE